MGLATAPLPIAVLDDSQRLACLRLIRSENVGPVTFRELINHFGGAEAALAALPEMSRHGGRRRPISICPRDVAEAELTAAEKAGARALFTIEPGFPKALTHVTGSPPMIYVRGHTALLARDAVAIVGARNGSAAGITLTRQFAAGFGANGYVVVSGLARGIDGAAHEASLATGTIAVLAGGIDHVYPPEHADLTARIAAEGCLVAEQPPGFTPRAQDFPRRNRIIAGLALGVLIVEAAKRSGSLITARMAGDQGREVFAVPGHPLDPRAEGTNGLLKQGATMVTELKDVLDVLAPMREARGALAAAPAVKHLDERPSPADYAPPTALPADHRATVLSALGPAPVSLDAIAQATGLPMRAVRVVLLELALAGRLEQHGSQLVSLLPGGDT
ncbi:MAG: DNA-processing protein DprA [Hyphomicrobiaceae bacterium]